MKIVSKFHDYYDSALGHGADPNLRYIRNPREFAYDSLEVSQLLPIIASRTTTWNGGAHTLSWEFSEKTKKFYINTNLLGFCGKLYPYISVEVHDSSKRYPDPKNQHHYFYSQESFEEFLREHFEDMSFYTEKAPDFWSTKLRNHLIKWFFELKQDDDDIFFKFGDPCFKLQVEHHVRNSKYKVTVNPSLKNIQFYKVFDAFSTFQELSMFIGGVLGKAHPPLIQISDTDMRDKKGFDKWSFKTMPTKGK